MQLGTGRIAVANNGDIYSLTFTVTPPTMGFSVIQSGTGAPVAAEAPAAPAIRVGESQVLEYGTPMPPGLWEVVDGQVYAGADVRIRRVIIGG